MKLTSLIVATLLIGLSLCFSTAGEQKFVVTEIGASNQNLSSVLKAEVQKASSAHLKPVVLFYSNSCRPSMALVRSLDDPLMKDAFQSSYLIKANLDAWRGQVRSTGFSISATPTLFRVDEQLHVLHEITGAAWGANIPATMAPPLKRFVQEN